MKKKITIVLTLAMAICVTACGKEDDTSSTASVDNQISSQPTETNKPEEESSEPDTTDSPDVSSEDENTLGEWKTTDFEKYGISNLEKFDLGEMTYYTATEEGGITVMWEGITANDMDAITAYGESLFNKTAKMGGNHSTEFDEDAVKWVLANEYASFNDACRGWTYDFYYSDWYYEYNGNIISVAYYGESDKPLSLKVFIYSAA